MTCHAAVDIKGSALQNAAKSKEESLSVQNAVDRLLIVKNFIFI